MEDFGEKTIDLFEPQEMGIEKRSWFGADPKRTARIAKAILALNSPELSARDQVNIKKLIRGEPVSRTTDPEKILKRLNDVIFEQQSEADFNPGNITNRNNLKKHLQMRESLKLYIQWKKDVNSGKFTARRYSWFN